MGNVPCGRQEVAGNPAFGLISEIIVIFGCIVLNPVRCRSMMLSVTGNHLKDKKHVI